MPFADGTRRAHGETGVAFGIETSLAISGSETAKPVLSIGESVPTGTALFRRALTEFAERFRPRVTIFSWSP